MQYMVLGLGSWEIVVVGLALLVLFGPEHAPRAIRTLGRWQARLRNTLQQIEQTIEEESGELEEAGRIFRPSQPPPEAEAWVLEDPEELYAQQERAAEDRSEDETARSPAEEDTEDPDA